MATSLQSLIDSQAALVNHLKSTSSDPAIIKQSVDVLLALKAQANPTLSSTGDGKKKKQKLELKTPKGTKDHTPPEMILRNEVFRRIVKVFEAHGGVTIDTPVFELKEILSNKYGEDSKLIYDLSDQGGELCSLRYDLTVPFARFLALTGTTYQNIKRYHIAKVYRRDQPAMTKGRMREFYQCDFDIAGSYDAMLPDSEVVVIVGQVLKDLDVGEFTIKINHRKVLDGIFEVCGVPEQLVRPISSAVDKLDKTPWEEVKKEMTVEKGLSEESADKIGEYVKLKGRQDLLEKLLKDETLMSSKKAKEGLEDMQKLFDYLNMFSTTSVLEHVSFDLSLARGLDYYTGIIYEAITQASAPPRSAALPSTVPSDNSKPTSEDEDPNVGVGSIAGGGRYDELVGMFSAASSSKSAGKIPCVGVSFGVERIYSIVKERWGKELIEGRGKKTEVFVMSVGDGMLKERLEIVDRLWQGGIKTEFLYKLKPKPKPQFDRIDTDKVRFAVIVAPDEWNVGKVRIKDQKTSKEGGSEEKGEVVDREKIVEWLRERLYPNGKTEDA